MVVKKEVEKEKPKVLRSVRKDRIAEYEQKGWRVVKETGRKRFRELQGDLVLMEK